MYEIGQLPILHLSYGNLVLEEIGARGPLTVDELLEAVDPETLFKSDREHRDPSGRAKAVVRFAAGLGLVETENGAARLTDLGRGYVEEIDPREPFSTSETQAALLRLQVTNESLSPIGMGTVLALSLVASAGDEEVLPDDLGRAIAAIAGKGAWRQPRTFHSQGERFLALLRDMRLVDADDNLTTDGADVMNRIQRPSHPPLAEILDELATGSGDSRRAWMIRAGQAGKNEELALEKGVAVIGWERIPDLRGMSREVLTAAIGGAYQHEYEGNSRRIGQAVGQVFAFANTVSVGDVIVLPLDNPRRHVAIGIVTGEYRPREEPAFDDDARHTREVNWIASPIPYSAFDAEMTRRFGLQGTVRQIRLPDAADRLLSVLDTQDAAALQLVLKWSKAHGADTIERHSEVADDNGAVWWRVHGSANANGLSDRRIAQFQQQLADGEQTYAYLYGPTCWRTELLAIQTEPPADSEQHLVPSYYDPSANALLWVKLRDFVPVARSTVESDFALERDRSKGVSGQGDRRFAVVVPRTPRADLPTGDPPDDEFEDEFDDAPYEEPPFETVVNAVRDSGMEIDERMLRRYHLALRTRGFVILSGVSGTGKTWLTELYADAVGAAYKLVAVAPNWTTNEELLGYLNPFDRKYYDTAFSDFLRTAATEHERAVQQNRAAKPFHLVLDEMNLARVEHYFAKFLSAIEGRARNGSEPIELASNRQVTLPPNLRFIGTVNVDETTHGFADKVYDRAQLLEVELTRAGMERQLGESPYAATVLAIWDAMRPVAPFAYRTIDEIDRYVEEATALGVPLDEAIDEQILHKVLPKLSGTDPRVGDVLAELLSLTDGEHPLSHAKIERMLASVEQHGFASYFEF